MKQLIFDKQCDLSVLQEALFKIQELQPCFDKTQQPSSGLARFTVTGNEEITQIYVPDDLGEDVIDEIKKIVDEHQPPSPISALKAEKIQQLYAERNFRLNQLLLLGDGQTLRSQGETLTWSAKVAEAKRFQESNDLDDCPLLVVETTAYLNEPTAKEVKEGVTRLAQTLIEKEPQLLQASAYIIGKSGRIQESIMKATTIEELQSIDLAQGWE